MAKVFVTTSWDDDHGSDLQLAEMLSAYGIRGTFYVPTGKLGTGSCLSTGDIRNLAVGGFEIGAHTVSHAILPSLNHEELVREVGECKKVLQQILSAEVSMFCYPKGRFNSDVVNAVKNAGYRGARGARMLSLGDTSEPFKIPVTVQAFPHSRTNYVRNLLRRGALRSLLRSSPELVHFRDWVHLGKIMFDRVLRHGGIWHLYGHSWEIQRRNLWPQLKDMLQYVSRRPDVTYITNGQILDCRAELAPYRRLAPSRTAGQ